MAEELSVNTEVQVYNGMGIHSVPIALPPDAVSFESVTVNPLLGTVTPSTSGQLSVNYQYNSSGVDAFGVSYLAADGDLRTQIVRITIFDDYTGIVDLAQEEPQAEEDFLGSLYGSFVNAGTGTTSSGSFSGTGNLAGGPASSPEMIVKGKNIEIVDGDNDPDTRDDTDFGIVPIGSFVEHTFTVANTGTGALYLTPIQVIYGGGWIVSKQVPTFLQPGTSDTFKIRFQPLASGQSLGLLSIQNNDSDENPYTFTVRGATNAPEIGVSGLGQNITDGDSTPSLSDGTDFGTTTVGQPVQRTFTVHNSGSAILTLTTPVLPPGFSIVEPLASQLASSASDSFTVQFSPASAGTYPGEISIGNNDSDENPFNFSIRASVGAPEIEVRGNGNLIADGDSTPSTADGTDFGLLTTGQFTSRTFTVKNTGVATLTLSTPQLPSGFELTEGLVPQLASQASDTFTVKFSPQSTGSYGGEIVIGNNDADESPYNFAIKGEMNGPEISVYGNALMIADGDLIPSATDHTWFGTIGAGETLDRTFEVTNTGNAALSLFVRPLPAAFTMVESLASFLPPQTTDTFTVRFTPTAVGDYGGQITIDNNDSDENPYNFAIFGSQGVPEINVLGKGISIVDGDNTPSAIDDTYFGMTPPNIVTTRTFTVRNDGTTVLKLGQPTLSPASGFRMGSDTLLSELAAGQQDTFSIELVSPIATTYNSTVSIWNNDTGGLDGKNEAPYEFAIRGIVGAPEIDVTGKGITILDGDPMPSLSDDTDFGNVPSGTTVSRTFTVRNTGTGTLYLGTPSVTGTGFWRGAKTLATYLEPGQSDTFTVMFASTTPGGAWGDVTLYNSDANESPYNFAIRAFNNSAPTNISLSPSTIAENTVSPGRVGDLTATDPDPGDTHSFTLDSSFGDGSRFSIVGKTLYAAPLNFEDPHGPTYSIRVTATDAGGLSVTKTLTVSVTNINEAPTDITLNPSSIAENFGNPSHIVVGTLTAVDVDAGDSHTYSLNPAGDGVLFSIGGNVLYAKQPFDFEDAHGPTYSISVTARDSGGLTFTKALTITVTDVNEAPVIDPNQQFSVDENSAAGTVVGTVAFTDPDTADTHTFSITGGNTGGAFTISNSGVISIQTLTAVNFETNNSFTLTIQITDSGTPALSSTSTVVITVNDVPEAPRIVDLDTRTANLDHPNLTLNLEANLGQGNPSDALVTKMHATDEDLGEEATLDWRIIHGNADGLFGIQGSGPNVSLVLRKPLTDATKSTYNLFIEVYDTTGRVDQGTVTVNVSGVVVGFLVDSQAVEGSATDDITITFYRYAIGNNYTSALDVYVYHGLPATEPSMGGLAISDFDASAAGLALLNSQQITIPAGQQSVSVTLSAVADSLIENLEDGTIQIVSPPISASPYTIASNSTPVAGEDFRKIYSSATLQVLDGWTLFADGTPTSPDGFAVYYDDIQQQGIGDCYCFAAIAELAVTHSSVIYNSMQRIGTTDQVTVKYFDANGTQQTTTVTVNLDRGFDGAGLSGDYDSSGVEVWTWVLERAYAQTHGGYINIGDGGFSDDTWTWLTGKGATQSYSSGKTDQQIWDEIESNFGNSHENGVIVDTVSSPPDLLTINEVHSLAVIELKKDAAGNPVSVELWNPWGNPVSLPFNKLDENILRVIIGTF